MLNVPSSKEGPWVEETFKNNVTKTGRVQTARRSWETQQQQLPQFPTLKIPNLCSVQQWPTTPPSPPPPPAAVKS